MTRHMGKEYMNDSDEKYKKLTKMEFTMWIHSMQTSELPGLADAVLEYEKVKDNTHLRVPLVRLLRILASDDPIFQLVRQPAPSLLLNIANSTEGQVDSVTMQQLLVLCPFVAQIFNAYYTYGTDHNIPQFFRTLLQSIAAKAAYVLQTISAHIPIQNTCEGEPDWKDNRSVYSISQDIPG